MEQILKIIEGLLGGWGPAAQILLWVGVLRLIFKPTFSWLQTVAAATPSPKDDSILSAIMHSGAYKGIAWVLDLLGSIKLPKKEG